MSGIVCWFFLRQHHGPSARDGRAVHLVDGDDLRADVAFLAQFGQPPRLLACECERSDETTMGQSFSLISGPQVNNLLKSKGNLLSRLLAEKSDDASRVEALYWNLLTRAPSTQERQVMATMLTHAKDKRAVLEDLAWSLVNAKEFVLRK